MPARPGWKYVPSIVSLLAVALIAVNYFTPFADLDFTWQIRTGEEVVRTGDLRPRDAFTYTIAGKDVPEFEGLYGAGLWVVWSFFGYGGLKLLRVLLVGGPLLLVGLRLRREGVRWRGIAAALAILVLVEAPAWNLRPLYLSTIGLLLVAGRLHDHCTGRRPLPWWLPLLTLAWANLHPGVVMGQGLLVGAIGWEWLNSRLRLNTPLDRRALLAVDLDRRPGAGLHVRQPRPARPAALSVLARSASRHFAVHPGNAAAVRLRLGSRHSPSPWSMPSPRLTAWTVVRRFRQYRLWEIALLSGPGMAGQSGLSRRAGLAARHADAGRPHLARMARVGGARRRRTADPPGVAVRRLRETSAAHAGVPLAMGLAGRGAGGAGGRLGHPTPEPGDAGAGQPGLAGRRRRLDRRARRRRPRLRPAGRRGLPHVAATRRPGYVDTRYLFFPPELIEDCQYLPQLAPDWPERLRRVRSYGTDYFLLKTNGPPGTLWRTIQPHVHDPLYLDESVVLLRPDQVAAGLAECEQAQGREPLTAGRVYANGGTRSRVAAMRAAHMPEDVDPCKAPS